MGRTSKRYVRVKSCDAPTIDRHENQLNVNMRMLRNVRCAGQSNIQRTFKLRSTEFMNSTTSRQFAAKFQAAQTLSKAITEDSISQNRI